MSAVMHQSDLGVEILPFVAQNLEARVLSLAHRFLGRLWRVLVSERDERLWAMYLQMYDVYLDDLVRSLSEKEFEGRLEALVRNQEAESLQTQINILAYQGGRCVVGGSWESVLGRHVRGGESKIREWAELVALRDRVVRARVIDFDDRAALASWTEKKVSSLVDDVCVPPELAQALEESRKGVFCFLALVFAPKPIAPNLSGLMLDHAIRGQRAYLSIFAKPCGVQLPKHLNLDPIHIQEAFEAYLQSHELLDQSAHDALASDQSVYPVFPDEATPAEACAEV